MVMNKRTYNRILTGIIVASIFIPLFVPEEILCNISFIVVYCVAVFASVLTVCVLKIKVARQEGKEDIKRIIETNDIVALRTRLKKQGIIAATSFVFFLLVTVLGVMNPENWQWYHWLFPVFTVICFVAMMFDILSYNRLGNKND